MLKDRVYIVTGGGGAIARAILRAFADAGARLSVVDVTLELARGGAATVDGLALAADLTTAAGAAEMVRATVGALGRVDGLIHTVGGFAMGGVADSAPELYDRMFDLNVRTLFHALRAVVPPLLAQNDGFVAAFSSEPAWTGAAPGTALYGAAKAAAAHLMHSLDAELRGSAVRVTVVYPMGAVDTPANRRDMPAADPARWIDPAQIAETLRFAASRSPRGRVLDLPIYPPR
jgi:NADP-dependent 3-hydroxy acid dehydrogenase YdfG